MYLYTPIHVPRIQCRTLASHEVPANQKYTQLTVLNVRKHILLQT